MTVEYAGVGLVFLIIGLLEVIKKAGLDARWVPLCSLALGLAAGFLIHGFDPSLASESVVMGLAMGLSAVGLYSGTKNTVGSDKAE